jgi:hypothetical protein
MPGYLGLALAAERLLIRVLGGVGAACSSGRKRSRLSSSCPLGLVVVTAAGCALFTCQPISVIVAEKQERQRVDITPTGFRTDETGRVE